MIVRRQDNQQESMQVKEKKTEMVKFWHNDSCALSVKNCCYTWCLNYILKWLGVGKETPSK